MRPGVCHKEHVSAIARRNACMIALPDVICNSPAKNFEIGNRETEIEDSWFVACGPWLVIRGSWFVARGPWLVIRGSWLVIRGSWLVVRDFVRSVIAPVVEIRNWWLVQDVRR